MRRADRLFQIVQILRRQRQPVAASTIAAELETSVRTVYRDIADMMAQRVPIRGEAGVGYVLEAGHDLPPLMLTPDEIEAAALGAQWVMLRADPVLSRAAKDLLAKIEAALPDRLRQHVFDPASFAAPVYDTPADAIDMTQLRGHIRTGRKIALTYRDGEGRESRRIVWPVTVFYIDTVSMLVAWCETRNDFRSFRTDRIAAADFLDEKYPARPAALRRQWFSVAGRPKANEPA
jgi:predicted DNA-binding transcriptional regulator YafY